MVAHVAYRELREPERAIAPAVPHLRQEPADRIALLREPAREARAVAEARRVPEHQRVAAVGLDQRIRRRLGRHVRRVADLADVAREQRARERRLARVRVRDERQRDRGAGVAHGIRIGDGAHHAGAPSRAASSAASAASASGAFRSTNTGATRWLAASVAPQRAAFVALAGVVPPARVQRRLVHDDDQRPRVRARAPRGSGRALPAPAWRSR